MADAEPVRDAPLPDAAPGRLRRRAEFLAAAAGRRFHTERMTVQGRLRDEGPLRIGFTVTKRVGHATERNRIRRRLRVAATSAGGPHAAVPADVVVVARREALSAPFDLLVTDLARAFATVTRPRPPGHSNIQSRPTTRSKRRDHPGAPPA